MSTVLCTNGVTSKALAVTRSLGARGIRVITADKLAWHCSGFSKYSSKSLVYPDPVKHRERFADWLAVTIQREGIEVVYVMDDDTMDVVMEYRDVLEPLCKLTLPPAEGYRIAADKGLTAQLALAAGVPCPQTVIPAFGLDVNQAELLQLTESMQYPLTIKPRRSSGSRGIRFVHSPGELWERYDEIHRNYPNPILQEYIPPGAKYDVCVCYDSKHELKASFVQREVRNYPLDRGPSTVQESVQYPELLNYSLELLDKLRWIGVADVEFMIDPRSGKPMLMEINPRFWSSSNLAIRSGVDFPWIVYRTMTQIEADPVTEYTVGQQCRSLLPGDLLHYISNPKRGAMDPPFWTTRLPDDIVSRQDPWATLGFIGSAIWYMLNPKSTWKFLIRR